MIRKHGHKPIEISDAAYPMKSEPRYVGRSWPAFRASLIFLITVGIAIRVGYCAAEATL